MTVKAIKSPRKSVIASGLALLLGVPLGIGVDRFLLNPSDPVSLLIRAASQALTQRHIESAAKYHKAQAKLQDEQILREAVQKKSDKVAANALARASRKAREAEKQIALLQNEMDNRQPRLVEIEKQVEVLIESPEAAQLFKRYVSETEVQIQTVIQQRNLYANQLREERTLREQLLDQVKTRNAVVEILKERLELSEKRVKELDGRKVRWGPGCTAGAGSNLLPPGQTVKPSVSCGIAIIWG